MISKIKKICKKYYLIKWLGRYFINQYRFRIEMPAKLKFIEKNYGYIAENYRNDKITINRCTNKSSIYKVWCCWLQGEKNMPDYVKMCYYFLLKNADGHEVNLITLDNYDSFIELPSYVIEKYKKGMIPNAHFVDIIRMCLLYKYGGLYLDMTILLTFPLNKLNLTDSFWTPKWKLPNGNTNFVIGVLYNPPKNSFYVSYLKDCFLEYWKNNNKLFAYTWDSYFVKIANIKSLNKEICDVPTLELEHDLFRSANILNKPFNNTILTNLSSKCVFYRISYKDVFQKITNNGGITYFGHLYKEYTEYKKGEK